MTGEASGAAVDRIYPTVGSATVTTARSSLDLFELPYPFSQAKLLTPSEFGKLAEQRRSRADQGLPPVNEQMLEELHRCGVLVPLLRVDLVASGDVPGIDLSTSLSAKHLHTSMINEVLRGAAEGRVMDPAVVGFKPWPRERRRQLWPSVDSGYLYSRHQLLGLDVAMHFVKKLRGRREDHRVIYELEEASLPNAPTREALASWRSLAIVLSALDTNYWPQVTHLLHGDFKVWRTAIAAFDAPTIRDWLGLTLDQLDPQITSLHATASFADDTGDFYELIRRAKADAWKSLRGDAAAAMDYRLAADTLVRFAEDLNPGADHAAAKRETPIMQAMSARPESLDAVLTDLWLSPFPLLVIGVEGATEYLLVPKVLRLLGVEWDRNRIEIVDFGGTERDLALLARYAAEPLLGRDLGSGVCLDRPLTKFLVMTDAENKYREAADRRKQRKLLLDSLTVNVPTDLRADYYNNWRRDRVVEIVTWGKLPFEFAHFKDRELADAMLNAAKVPHPRGRDFLVQLLHKQRGDKAPDAEKLFWRGSGLRKPALAEALWPVLEGKIEMAIEQGKPGPPVMRACVRAYEMLAASEGKAWMLRRRRWRKEK